MTDQVKTSERVWSEECRKADSSKEEKPAYEFSNGRKFEEPKRPPQQ